MADNEEWAPSLGSSRDSNDSDASSHTRRASSPEEEKKSRQLLESHADGDDELRYTSPLEFAETQPDISEKGCIAGGSHAEELNKDEPPVSDHGPLKVVDFDLPLTSTEVRIINDEELVVLDFIDGDKENPFNWPRKRKALISTLLCLMTLFIGLGTTAYSSTIKRMTSDLNTSQELGQMGLFTFNAACAVAPLFLAPFCELAGRREVYVIAYALFAVMFIGLALGKNIATILVCRTLLGLFGCVGTILVGGTFTDIYNPDMRAAPMAFFSYAAILGTVAAPLYAGFSDQGIGWRWTEAIQGLSNVPLLILVVLFFRETRGSVVLRERAKQLHEKTGDNRYRGAADLEVSNIREMLYNSSVKAIYMLCTEPVVFAFALWIGFAWFVTFLFLSVIPITYSEKRGWDEGVSGLPYISLIIGVTIGLIGHTFQVKKYDAVSAANGGRIIPEARLYGAMCGAIFLPIGLYIYSFTQYAFILWIGPTIALAPIAIGIFFIFESSYSYTADCYGESSSSAIAGQGFVRNMLGAVSPLFASQFFHNVGSQYAGLILSLIATILAFIPFVFFKYGPYLRARSKLASSQLGGDLQKKKSRLTTYR